MSKNKIRWLIYLGVFSVLVMIFSACATLAAQPPEPTEAVYPTVIITQLVTQIVATPTITPIPPPTQQVQEVIPAAATGWDPFAVPIYYPIRGCAASRLHTGDVAFVANGSNGIHMSKDIGDAPIFRRLEPGEMIDIVLGPWCSRNALVWKIATADGYIGFTPEGDGEVYWLLPMPSDTERVLSKEEYKLRQIVRPGETIMLLGDKANYCR